MEMNPTMIKIYNQVCKVIFYSRSIFLSSQKYKFACDYKILNKHEIFFIIQKSFIINSIPLARRIKIQNLNSKTIDS